MISGISDDLGLEEFLIKPRSINTDSFIEFLEMIHGKYPE